MIFKIIEEKKFRNIKNLGNGYCEYKRDNITIYGDYFNFGDIELYLFEPINMGFINHYDTYYSIYIPFILMGEKAKLFFKELNNDEKYLFGWHNIIAIENQNVVVARYKKFYFSEFLCWLFREEIK